MAFCLTFSQKLYAQVILHVEHPLVRATNDCSEYLGHMTKMAVTPIYCENSYINFSRDERANDILTWNVPFRLQNTFGSKDVPWLTLTYWACTRIRCQMS